MRMRRGGAAPQAPSAGPGPVLAAPPKPGAEARIVAILCLLAALRVFVLSAGFPLFNNVDEQAHFDLVHKYARGHVPAGIEKQDAGAARDMTLYGTPEYLTPARGFAGGAAPPRYGAGRSRASGSRSRPT